jgi:hypothetical protein
MHRSLVNLETIELSLAKSSLLPYAFVFCSKLLPAMLTVVSLMLRPLRPIHDPLPLFMLHNIEIRPYKNGEGVTKQKLAKKGEWTKCKKMLIMRMWCSRQSSNLMIQVNASAGELCIHRRGSRVCVRKNLASTILGVLCWPTILASDKTVTLKSKKKMAWCFFVYHNCRLW